MAKLIFGCGYLGSRVANRWLDDGQQVHVVTRSTERARQFEKQGYLPIVADVTAPATLVKLPVADTVLYSVGFDRAAGKSIHQVYVDGLRGVLGKLPHQTGRVIYISSTGVYGQADGDWVDEDSECRPVRDGGRACLAAENLLRADAISQRAVILRMAGIYGPGRIPRAEELRAGQAIPAPQEGYLNLIHVDDAARVVLAAEGSRKTPGLYVVSDGNPPTRREYYDELARLLGAPPPRFELPPADSPAALRAGSDKRVRNDRMLNELGVQLLYPTYRQGLASIVAAEENRQV